MTAAIGAALNSAVSAVTSIANAASTALTSAVEGMYVDFSIPLGLYSLLQQCCANTQGDPNTPQVVQPPALRMWFSQPRPANSAALPQSLTEVLTVNFKLPLSVSEMGFDALRVGCHIELWYLDRLNNWRAICDETMNPLTVDLSVSQTQAWYTAHFYCYPIVAKAVQWRITRVYDPLVGTQPYVVGIRNGLIRRNIYTLADGTQGIEPAQDPVGNIFASYLKHWDAAKCFDNHPHTYWKSMPQPDPAAVVNLYLDVRNAGGAAQLMDTLYLDPVYAGQMLNVYYSNDDSVGTRKLSPVTAVPTTDENTQWQQGTGRWDISDVGGTTDYKFPFAAGPLKNQDAWVGIEWTPDFNPGYSNAEQTIVVTGSPTGGTFTLSYGGAISVPIPYNAAPSALQSALVGMSSIGAGNLLVTSGLAGGPWTVTFLNNLGAQAIANLVPDITNLTGGGVTVTTVVTGGQPGGPPQNPILLQVVPANPTTGQFCPTIYYDVGAAEIVLKLTDGTTTYGPGSGLPGCPLSPLPTQYTPLRIMVGWEYSPSPTVFIEVTTSRQAVLGTVSQPLPPACTQMSFDGTIGFHDFRGLFTAHVIKLENWATAVPSFMANPQVYVSPDPVIPDSHGNIPATSLDNAIYAAAWVMQEHGTGGGDATHYTEKTWTPVWRDYLCQKGKLFFPQQISCKYLNLEFSNLTPEPYPVYDAGIQTSYQVFPVSVTQSITTSGPRPSGLAGLLTVGADVLLQGVGSVNWLNPSTINKAVNSLYGQTVSPMSVTTGPGYNTSTLPNTVDLSLTEQTRTEVSSPWLFKRQVPNPTTLAAQQINVTTSAPLIQSGATALAASSLLPVANGSNPADAFTPLLNNAFAPTTLPQQGADWWVFPGGTLRLPAAVMNGLTALTDVVTGRVITTDTRLRFTTTMVHRYDVRTVTRDAAVGYFAGIREVQPYVTTYINEQDPDVFAFSLYDPVATWVATNTASLASGPITTATPFSYEILNSNFDTDINNWIQQTGVWSFDPAIGHWYLGAATVTADGTTKTLVSSYMDVTPGTHIDASVWAHWTGLAAPSGALAIQLCAFYYNAPVPRVDETDAPFVSSDVRGLTYSPWPASTPADPGGNVWVQITAAAADSTGFTVPPGVNVMRLALVVDSSATAGQVWFDTVEVSTTDATEGTLFRDFQTTSQFNKVTCVFTDTGLVRSDDMWATPNLNDTNVGATDLAYYTTLIPDQIPAGMWADSFADWSDQIIVWGEPRAVVAIQVDPNRTFQGKRVLHFTRAAGAGIAGVKIRQQLNFVAGGLFRIGAIYYKPNANANQVTVALRRISDGVYIYEETFTPIVGYWFEYLSDFIAIPEVDDQQYSVEFTCSGDAADEMYLNDLWCDIAQIRYRVGMGSIGENPLLDVTALRYTGLAITSCTDPVQEFYVQVAILSPHSYAYGASFTPNYLN
jgi:hypothetical protein